MIDRPGQSRRAAGYTSSHTNPLNQTRRVPRLRPPAALGRMLWKQLHLGMANWQPEPWAYW